MSLIWRKLGLTGAIHALGAGYLPGMMRGGCYGTSVGPLPPIMNFGMRGIGAGKRKRLKVAAGGQAPDCLEQSTAAWPGKLTRGTGKDAMVGRDAPVPQSCQFKCMGAN